MISMEFISSTPVYSIVENEKFLFNPFREFMYYCATSVFSSLENKSNMSLNDFYELSTLNVKNVNDCDEDEPANNAELKLIESLKSNISSDDIKVECYKPEHKKIFVQCDIKFKNKNICELKFFKHIVFIAGEHIEDENNEKEYVACELNFKEFDEFLHLLDDNENYKSSMVYMFAKDDNDKDTFDMIVAHIKGLCNFTDFMRSYKSKSLAAKNANMFIEKLVSPYVSDYEVYFTSENFIVSMICGCTLHRVACTYDNYLSQIKDIKDKIISKYGEKYHKPKEQE